LCLGTNDKAYITHWYAREEKRNVHQVKRHVDFADGVEAPGGFAGEGPDLGDGAVDELEEVVLVALCGTNE
jgi:hypothetical protein